METPAQWARTTDRSIWCASVGDTVMTASRLVTGGWRAAVRDARSPVLGTRLLAQQWAERNAGGAE